MHAAARAYGKASSAPHRVRAPDSLVGSLSDLPPGPSTTQATATLWAGGSSEGHLDMGMTSCPHADVVSLLSASVSIAAKGMKVLGVTPS